MPEASFDSSDMKHPSPQVESFVFNLGKAQGLRCTGTDKKICGKCEGCLFQMKITPVKAWLCRAGDQAKRRFMLGLLRRLHSVDLVRYVVNLLQPMLCKDFMYARSRSKPSLATDSATMSNDRALNVVELEKNIAETWDWFQSSSYWTKSNFIVTMLQECEQHLLHSIGIQARTLLTSEEAAFMPYDEYENQSVADTIHSYESDTRSELDLLTSANPEYSVPPRNPFEQYDEFASTNGDQIRTDFTPAPPSAFTNYEDEIINDDSGDELFGEDAMFGEIDPTCLVVPGSSKAYSGVAKHKDFIRYLPIHISKCILGMLDQVSLFNCVCVSKNWRYVAEEVHKEYYINQHLQEEVMLMQGASAHGCNPLYAKDIDVAVPNIESNSWAAKRTGEQSVETTFKSEISFDTAYSGFETRKIIMEERNVYCGAYNVMVLIDEADSQRVVHTDGGRLISLGSHDRKVRLVDTETCHQVDPVITGHAGSIRCVALCEKRGFVISGSFDTSVRLWSLETGKCQKIFRGHRDTVLCLQVCGNFLVSGAKDNMCKVWNMETKKCMRTFKHRHPITAVAMSDEMVMSGCEAGKVKVWHMESGKLIKLLRGHQKAVTCIRFDRWHIITGSKDGYALAWSAQGDHKRCLTALRHPEEVLSLELMYLRVITGSADGKLRIWNMVTGQCLRIMRGNSKSDPILALIAIDNRITINTSRNLLVLNFEPVEHDYTLENDKMPPLVQYSKYSDAPIRKQPYAYIRANRMGKAGAGNPKIVYHDGAEPPEVYYNNKARAEQVPHSAMSLSRKSLHSAKRIQSAQSRLEDVQSTTKTIKSATAKDYDDDVSDRYARDYDVKSMIAQSIRSVSIREGKPPSGMHHHHSRAATAKSRAGFSTRSGTQSIVSVSGFRIGGRGDEDSSVISEEDEERRRRVSWAFEKPQIPLTSHMGLTETKSLLRSQMRVQGETVPPDFVYLTVNTIHSNMKPTEASKNMEMNRRTQEINNMKKMGRPNSSPSRVDPRTKVPIEELNWEEFCIEHGLAPKDTDAKSLAESRISHSTRTSLRSKKTMADEAANEDLPTTKIITEFAPVPVDSKPAMSLYDKRIKSSIPKARLIRPHTAKVIRDAKPLAQRPDNRPKSAIATTKPGALFSRPSTALSRPGTRMTSAHASRRPSTAQTHVSHVSSGSSDVTRIQKKTQGVTSSSKESSMVPMLMYSGDVKTRLEEMRQARLDRQALTALPPSGEGESPYYGNVSDYNGPMRDHVDFKLLTYEQALQQMAEMKSGFRDTRGKEEEEHEKRQKAAWLMRVKGQLDKDYMKKAKAFAPEIREIKDPLPVV